MPIVLNKFIGPAFVGGCTDSFLLSKESDKMLTHKHTVFAISLSP